MRVLAAVLLIALSGCAHGPGRSPASDACGERIAADVRAGSAAVPRYLYHFGRKSVLDADVRDRGIPVSVWRDAIMGPSDWKLPRFRRGLYGTERALRADAFANRIEPAMIRIEIRPECRDPRVVAATLGIDRDRRFADWKAKRPEWDALRCGEAGTVRLYAKYDRLDPDERTLRCEALVDAFLDESGMRVVHDEAVPASWYLRDPKCIATIEGTDAELVAMIGAPGFFSADRCGSPYRSLATARIFMGAVLRLGREPEDAGLARAFAAWAETDLDSPPSPGWIADFRGAYARCRRAGKIGALRDSLADFDGLLAAIENYELARKLEEEPVPDFDGLCR